MAGQRGSFSLLVPGIWSYDKRSKDHLPVKVVVRSSSLLFTVLSIIANAPITRVKCKPEAPVKKPASREESRIPVEMSSGAGRRS